MDVRRLYASGALRGPYTRRHVRQIDIWTIGMVSSGIAMLLYCLCLT